MKRHDPAWQHMLENLPDSAESLRYLRVVVHDPEFEPFFGPGEIFRATDIPAEVLEESREQRRTQVHEAVGAATPEVVTAFEGSFLGSLVHDVNLVHGLLEKMGEPLPAEVIGGRLVERGAGGDRFGAARERRAVGQRLDPAARRLRIPRVGRVLLCRRGAHAVVPLAVAEAVSDRLRGVAQGRRRASRRRSSSPTRRAFARELAHFHDCVVNGVECLTPPEQARLDMQVLTHMFLQAG